MADSFQPEAAKAPLYIWIKPDAGGPPGKYDLNEGPIPKGFSPTPHGGPDYPGKATIGQGKDSFQADSFQPEAPADTRKLANQARINAIPALSGIGAGIPSVGPMMGPAAPLAGVGMLAPAAASGAGMAARAVPAVAESASGGVLEKLLALGSVAGIPGTGFLHGALRLLARGAKATPKVEAPAPSPQMNLDFNQPVNPYGRVMNGPAMSPGETSNVRGILADRMAQAAGPGPTATPPPPQAPLVTSGTRPPLAPAPASPDAITALRRALQGNRAVPEVPSPAPVPEVVRQPLTGTRPAYDPGLVPRQKMIGNIPAQEAEQGAAISQALGGKHIPGTGTGIRLNQDWLERWIKTFGDIP